MRNTFVLLLFALIVIAWCMPTKASNLIIARWDARTHILTAKCMVAEADESEDDHIAIAYAMENWLKVRQRVHPHLNYVDVVKSMCSVHRVSERIITPRQRWIKQLSFPRRGEDGNPVFDMPPNFPKTASWKRKQKQWMLALHRAWNWAHGKYRDPCRDKAILWGAPQDPNDKNYLPSDRPSDNVTRVHCHGDLENWFYGFKPRKEQEQDAGDTGMQAAGVHGDVPEEVQ